MSDVAAPGLGGSPYQDLHIYYVEGRVDVAPGEVGASYIGNWVEDGYSFLFFSQPARESVERILTTQPGRVLVDEYRMRYEDWLGERFKRFSVGKFLIVPPWDPSPDDGGATARIVLDPGVVFGTGTHPTTRDCLELIEQVCKGDTIRTAVDVGTGTGLLALAAARAGCRRVIAFDFNFLAARTAIRNVALNGLSRNVLVFQGKAEEAACIPADLMIANIHFEVMMGMLASDAADGKRWLILSGLLRSQAAEVRRRLLAESVEIAAHRERDGIWHTFLGRVRR
ncbi:50S ribosomal protein L11 methyltransferase [Desulfococcus multivorans]|uniref:Ribosomal L11 methyltransferase n=1 Tax=Desulfococcus multivorans DSM 2059 TaxID=1121405 RepID=S7TH68_DESML|nr:50S ribosomal protein L11 methyltransferase [Desulfococcus multivorans]AOY59958.1 PrmA2: ribosomal protein L11 methyltransferase [Desulfococcus multivorans]EPR35955.1 ribosomal L11 methyltransferase [Desulfococcus multivorans DSM 2059]SJZ35803.1 ribosomal protein L11 methyltransferase [Desulfococcus multivorans DSM 2059]